MKLSIAIIATVIVTLIEANSQRISFPLVYKWSKRFKESEGCIDPSEPFQCPGTNVCISLQFVCDEHPKDCPDNYDEDHSVCVACNFINK